MFGGVERCCHEVRFETRRCVKMRLRPEFPFRLLLFPPFPFLHLLFLSLPSPFDSPFPRYFPPQIQLDGWGALVSSLKAEQLIKKQTYAKTDTRKLYSSLLNVSVKFHENRSLQFRAIYRFKVCAFFETQCIVDGAGIGQIFSARQHIARCMPSPIRPSVRPSHGWISQTLEVRITQPSPQSSPMPLVSWCLTSPRNSKGNIASGAPNKTGV